ncbi:MAG TPA: AraC family transcriptional regulator [Candidatus Limnocylindrales bacterium]|nr:AraC family transcriptional regulator [Candidatus Limnocylindrales bacterium]
MDAPATDLRAWRPPIAGVREVLHARYIGHAFPRHAHDTWTLFVVDEGGVRYDLGRHERVAAQTMVSVLPPHVAHDGRPAVPDGYRMRVLYVETSVLPASLIGPAVDRPFVEDALLRRRVAAVHDALDSPDGPLEAETRLAFVTERLTELLRASPEPARRAPSPPTLAEAVRAHLDASLFERPSLAEIAAAEGFAASTSARAFTRAFGLPPHQYVLSRRLEAARSRILDGQPLATVAVDLGFVDQAHMTRRFTRLFGTSPSYLRRDRRDGR